MDLEVRVDRLAVGGDGLGRQDDGRVVFVRGALPGELVRARVTAATRDYAKAEIVDVIEAGPARVAPACPFVAAGCGGCGWQHVAGTAQLDLKVAMVRDALTRQGRLADARVDAGGSVASSGYRTTVRLAVLADGRLGFRAAASHRLVPIGGCDVARRSISELIPVVRVNGADEVVLRVGVATGERLAWGTGGSAAHLSGLPADVAVGQHTWVHEDVAGHRFRVSAPSFFQSSPEGAALLADTVRNLAGEAAQTAARLVDLYSGVGLFAAVVAPQAEVVCVESSASSCADARRNLAGRPVTVVHADVERWAPVASDLVVADPSRRGLGRGGVDAVAATGAPVVVLVSCDAAALGRDVHLLALAGYTHAGSTVLDLFPQTPHVEVVSRFERTGRR